MNNEELTSGQKGSFTRMKNKIKDEADSLLNELRQQKQEISELRSYLLDDDDDDEGQCLKSQFEESKVEICKAVEKAEDLLLEICNAHDRIHDSPSGLLTDIELTKLDIDEILAESSAARKNLMSPILNSMEIVTPPRGLNQD